MYYPTIPYAIYLIYFKNLLLLSIICVYLSDVAKSAPLLSPHRPGGLHRMMCRRCADVAHHAVLQNSLMRARKLRKAAGPLSAMNKKRLSILKD